MFGEKFHATHILIISMIIFVVLNIIENVIHYNIGKHSDKNLKIDNPTINDWIKIVLTMIIFALLQGFFTLYFSRSDIINT